MCRDDLWEKVVDHWKHRVEVLECEIAELKRGVGTDDASTEHKHEVVIKLEQDSLNTINISQLSEAICKQMKRDVKRGSGNG